MDKYMKVKFKKEYKHTIKTFKKGSVVELDKGFAKFLIKEKIACLTDEVDAEKEIIKRLKTD